jgi:hypothetical protein
MSLADADADDMSNEREERAAQVAQHETNRRGRSDAGRRRRTHHDESAASDMTI